jgi:hypothetical protein
MTTEEKRKFSSLEEVLCAYLPDYPPRPGSGSEMSPEDRANRLADSLIRSFRTSFSRSRQGLSKDITAKSEG